MHLDRKRKSPRQEVPPANTPSLELKLLNTRLFLLSLVFVTPHRVYLIQ